LDVQLLEEEEIALIEAGTFSRCGPYLIVQSSGAGGMGRVELALRADGQEPAMCVLKRMHSGERAPEQEARFEREARIAARLSHQNIARTLRVEVIEGELCLAQEFVEGVNLARLAKQAGNHGIPPSAAAYVAREVASALAYAHDFGGLEIVHRDVTPENIMLSYTGDVKLIDFGISRSRVDGTLTNVGMIVGRRAYISPEGWAGEKADRRADIYALGVVLWEMLTARRLEELDGARWEQGVPDPREFKADIASELATITMTALAQDPAKRYQSAAEFRDALGPFAGTHGDQKAEMGTLLAFYFNVERARDLTASEIADARKVIQAAIPARAGRVRPSQGIWVALVVAGVILASGIAISGLRRPASDHSGDERRGFVPTPTTAVGPVASVAPQKPPVPLATIPNSSVPGPERMAKESTATVRAAAPAKHDQFQDLLRRANESWDDGKLTEAESLARKAISAGAGADAHALLGSIYVSKEQLGRAEGEFAEAMRLNPHNAETAKLLADVRKTRSEHGE
jgi:serine/threonine-protein kinase